MKTELIRANQALFDEAYGYLCDSSQAMVCFLPRFASELPASQIHDLDRAIKQASRGLGLLMVLRGIRDAEETVNLSESTNGMVESDTPLLDAGESPVIRALPVTDKIVPLNWVSGALPEMQRTH